MGGTTNVLQFAKEDIQTKPIEKTEMDILLSLASQFSRVEMQNMDIIEQVKNIQRLLELKPHVSKTESYYIPVTLSPHPLVREYWKVYEENVTHVRIQNPSIVVPISATAGHSPTQVPLYVILKVGATLVGFICIASLATWLLSNVSLVNPFVALLGLIATPFFYWMGYIEKIKVVD